MLTRLGAVLLGLIGIIFIPVTWGEYYSIIPLLIIVVAVILFVIGLNIKDRKDEKKYPNKDDFYDDEEDDSFF